MLLGDLGADVLKVEPPAGDETRQWGPPYAGDPADGMSAYYLSVNRNKRSLVLNLKNPAGQTLARRLAARAQVLVENLKAGDMAAFGLDYPRLRAENPALVYCSITGFGQQGPYHTRPGYDYVIQAMSGLMSITGEQAGEASKVGVAVSDVFTGLYAASAIQAALRHAEHTGAGQQLDAALLDAQLAALVNVASNVLTSGQTAPRYGNAHPNIVPYQTFYAADRAFVLACGNDGQFRALCRLLNQEYLCADARFASNPARVTHREALIPLLQAAFAQHTADHWVEALLAAGIPAGPINDVKTALDDAHVQARGLVRQAALPGGESWSYVGFPVGFSATPPQTRHVPPLRGQHTHELLRDWLDMDADEIAVLAADGALG